MIWKWLFTLLLNAFVLLLVMLLHYRPADTWLAAYLPDKLQTLPALGKFFDPFQGFWANAEGSRALKNRTLHIEGLQANVRILFDDRLVPHIFADNDHDLYFAQGYVTAMYRLWQMDFQTRAAAGRLSEIVGERALEFDRFQRRIGMVYAAEQALEAHRQDSVSRMIVEAYSAGVNAYIQQLSPAQLPFEYKLLDYTPEPWTPLKTALLLKYMAFDLSAKGNSDHALSQALAAYGKATIDTVFGNRPFRENPVIPEDATLSFKALAIAKPKSADSAYMQVARQLIRHKANQLSLGWSAEEIPLGSNNWAVASSKTASKKPILANDPHLQLRLPSIWYEVQLHAPGCNVYGVSLPGAPGVVIGFNDSIAWGVTNSYVDVLDFYRVEFKDDSLQAYRFNDQWYPTQMRQEYIYIRGKQEPIVEQVPYTLWGPVPYTDTPLATQFGLSVPRHHAIRWVAHEPSLEVKTFYQLNRAHNYEAFVDALRYFACPSQNFVYADLSGNIALWVNGRHPLRWYEQGKFLMPGSDSTFAWKAYIPFEQNPHVVNPRQGFVSSANQHSVSARQYPYYLGWDYISADRALRINEVLAGLRRASVEDMRSLQNDELNVLAREVLPRMLTPLRRLPLEEDYAKAFQLLESWNYENSAESIAATIFEVWWQELSHNIWYDDFPPPMRMPKLETTLQLVLQDTTSHWFDDKNTLEKEGYEQMVVRAFEQTMRQLSQRHGPLSEQWQWWRHKATRIEHLALIPGLGTEPLKIGGGSRMVNATGSTHGPSWRMIVQLGSPIQAYGIYPGGQSGNPGSPYYNNMIEMWRTGSLANLLFLQRAEDMSDNRQLFELLLQKDSENK